MMHLFCTQSARWDISTPSRIVDGAVSELSTHVNSPGRTYLKLGDLQLCHGCHKVLYLVWFVQVSDSR
jgi:hypothetical protein